MRSRRHYPDAMACRLSSLLALGLAIAPIVVAPSDASACSWSPFVSESRIEGTIPVCLGAGKTSEEAPGQDYDPDGRHTNLYLSSSCETSVEFRLPDCVDCRDRLQLETEDSVVVDVGIYIDETVGEDIAVPVEWSTADDAGEFTVVFEMADTHPDDQDPGDCGPFGCSVGGQGGAPAFAALLLLVGAWSRRRRGTRPRSSRRAPARWCSRADA